MIKAYFSSLISHLSFSRGFTLIELLVVMGLLGVLAGGLLTIINPLDKIDKANDARRKSDLAQIQKALEQYYQDFGAYPRGIQEEEYQILTTDGLDQVKEWGTAWPPYMDIVPKDPDSPNKSYVYVTDSDNLKPQSYKLYTSLDRADKDLQACNNGAKCADAPGIPACGAGTECTYGVSSPNVSP